MNDDDARSVRSAKEIRTQLRDLAQVKKAAEEYGFPDFASKLSWDSLCAHESDLMDELRAAELLDSEADAEFSFEGEPISNHNVPALLFGEFLRYLQSFVYNLAQVQVGRQTTRGGFTQNIVRDFRLLVTPQLLEGSFRFRVRLPQLQESDAPALSSHGHQGFPWRILALGVIPHSAVHNR